MKIFMTSDSYLPLIGGAEIHVFELQKRLREQGHDIKLFVTETRKDQTDGRYPVTRDSWSLLKSPVLLFKIARLSKGSDVYHSHYSYKLAILTGIVARLRRKPFIVTLHGLGTLNQPKAPWFYDKLHRIYRQLSLRLATKIISTSQDLADVSRRYVKNLNIIIIENGLDTSIFDPEKVTPSNDQRLQNAHPLLLTVRRLVPKNGIHYAISAMPEILKTYPNAKLAMIGDGRMREYLEELAKKLGVENACIFLGRLSNSEVPPIAVLADIVLFPSTAESTSIACAEMMSLKKPIIASRVGGLIELLGKDQERGLLVSIVPWESCSYDAPLDLPVESYRKIAEAVDVVLRDGTTTQMKTLLARKFAVENLNWQVVVKRTLEAYTS